MQKRETWILVVAALCGLAAFGMSAAKPPAPAPAGFVCAARPIAKGAEIRLEDLTKAEADKNVPATRAFLQPEDVAGKRALENLAAGKVISRSEVGRIEETPGAPGLADGMRALTIDASDLIGVPAGLVPDVAVDVMGEYSGSEAKSEMQLLVQGARVMTLERSSENNLRSITIGLTPAGAELVSRAVSRSKLRLLVRPGIAPRGLLATARFSTVEIIRGVDKERKVRLGVSK